MVSNWNYPQPRPGIAGQWDKFVGPGATRSEQILSLVPSTLAAVVISYYAYRYQLGWNLVEYIVTTLLAFDIVGGVITNATSSAKRWYHRQGQGFVQHFGFVAVHAFQIFLVAWLFRGFDMAFFGLVYGYLLFSALMTLVVPMYIQRSVALLCVCGAIILSTYVLSPTAGFEWFIPFLFIKLLVSHLTREEPYM